MGSVPREPENQSAISLIKSKNEAALRLSSKSNLAIAYMEPLVTGSGTGPSIQMVIGPRKLIRTTQH